jgi:hypothetical protein
VQQGWRDTQREVAIVIALKAGQMTSCRFFGSAGNIAALLKRPRTWLKIPKNLAPTSLGRETGFLMVWATYLYAGYSTCNYYRKATPDTPAKIRLATSARRRAMVAMVDNSFAKLETLNRTRDARDHSKSRPRRT